MPLVERGVAWDLATLTRPRTRDTNTGRDLPTARTTLIGQDPHLPFPLRLFLTASHSELWTWAPVGAVGSTGRAWSNNFSSTILFSISLFLARIRIDFDDPDAALGGMLISGNVCFIPQVGQWV